MPTLLFSQNLNSIASNTTTLTTSSFTPPAGAIIVVKGVTDDSANTLNTPTDTRGNTYTLRTSDATASHVWGAIWTARVATSASMTVSVGTGIASWHSITVEVWTSATLAASPTINGTKVGTGTTATSTIATIGERSIVSWLNGDWGANSPASRTYNTTSATPTEDGLHDKSTVDYVAYYAYQPAVTPGTQTFGVATPTPQTWTLLGIEILNGADSNQHAKERWHRWQQPWRKFKSTYELFASGIITSGQNVALNQTSETDLAQPIGRSKSKTLGQTNETDLAQVIGRQKSAAVGQASETDLAQPIARVKQRTLGQASETDLAQPITKGGPIQVPVNQASETDLAQAIARVKQRTLGQTNETDLAQAIGRRKSKTLGQTSETDLAQPITRVKQRTLGQATETDLAQAIGRQKRKTLGQTTETDLAQPITRGGVSPIINQASETDLAQAIGRQKRKTLGQATESDLAQPIARVKRKTLGQATETDLTQTIGRVKQRSVTQAIETEIGQAFARRKLKTLGQTSETDLAQPIFSPNAVVADFILGIPVLRWRTGSPSAAWAVAGPTPTTKTGGPLQ